MARPRKPINWEDCPVRKCRSEQICMICGEPIAVGDMYFDAGNNKRVHVGCVDVPEVSAPQEPVEEEAPVHDSETKKDVSTENVVVTTSSHEAIHVLSQTTERLIENFKKLQDQVFSLSNAVTEMQSRLEDLDERKANKDEIESFDPRELDFYDD